MDPGRLHDLIEAQDLNGLLAAVDSMCRAGAWDDLLDLADRCDDALERGKQLWPISAHIEYRIALEAPGEYAGPVLGSNLGRFMLGPLTEVAASTHRWEELAPYIDEPQDRAYAAQERVLRGEDLSSETAAEPDVLHLPLALQGWEPPYVLAIYRVDHVEVAEPLDPNQKLEWVDGRAGEPLDERELETALLDLVHPWVAESNGAARAVVVEGDAADAAATLGPERLRIAPLRPDAAMRWIAWAAASGGARGRRRGAAFGRSAAFYVCSMLADLQWPCDPDELGREIARLRWYRWDEGELEKGWVLRLAVADPDNGWGAAIAATDLLDEDDAEPQGQA